MKQKFNDQEIERRKNLEELKKLNINPYPAEEVEINNTSLKIKNSFKEGLKVMIAGRLISKRIMGKASFAQIKDSFGDIQIYVNRDEICPNENKEKYNLIFKKLLDLGDFIWVSGDLFTTKVGEKSIKVKDIKILSKSLKPLPVVKVDEEGKVHDEFKDTELRYRQRYVDLAVNSEIKNIFITRTKIINSMRAIFNKSNYLEVETPILQPIPGGAAARPFKTHHNTLDIPLYLRIAKELYLKKLIVGGYEGVYEFAKDFRNEGMDKSHNPEFTMLEIYVAYKDYNWMMDYTEHICKETVKNILNKEETEFGDFVLDFKKPFRRISMTDILQEKTGENILDLNKKELGDLCKKLKVEIKKDWSESKMINSIFDATCENEIIQPTFITDYPKIMSPLCKTHRSNPKLSERFELFIGGMEIANAYSELNDPIDQRERFEEQFELLQKGDNEAMFIDYDFLNALEYGMPPTAGLGIGIDRMVMLLTNQKTIQDVLFFPQMKPKK